MAEDSTVQQMNDDLPPSPSARHQPELGESCGTHSQQPIPSQCSKEKLYQQRQKCELRRLLKHTHPELKMLDDAVDEELAEVLSSEAMAADESGYEGEVLSKRLIFENRGLSSNVSHYAPKMHVEERSDERRDFSKTLAVLERTKEKPHAESVEEVLGVEKHLSCSPDSDRECEEQMVKIDVQATRRIFESQSVNTSKPNLDNKFQGNVSIYKAETKEVQKQKKQLENGFGENLQSKNKSRDLETEPHEQASCTQRSEHDFSIEEALFGEESTSLPDSETNDDVTKSRAALFQNNPFISTNIEREHCFVHMTKCQSTARDDGAGDGNTTTNVKNRTHLFESMPFDKIRRQNEDEIETMVESIKETLNFLYRVKAIQSTGSIVEVNETMIAKKASFTLSKSGPEMKHDEVAEGGAQNFILQLLPRVNLKPQVTYLKEDSKGAIETTLVTAPVQHQFSTNKDKEFKTANVLQLVEDILNQDNSLRKGVVIQEDDHNCAKVIVYSLYKYHNEEDVKSFIHPNAAENDESEVEKGGQSKTGHEEITKGVTKSIKGGLLELSQEETCPGSIMPEGKVKGSVKLFKSCIEKGDFEYLKSLQAEETAEELPENQTMAGQDTERLHEKGEEQVGETTCEWIPVDVKRLKSMFSGQPSSLQPKIKICKKESTHQAQLVEVVDDNEEISNLQTANHNLQQATNEAKSQSPEESHKAITQESSEEAIASVTADTVKHSREEAELSQENLTSGHKTEYQHKNTEDASSGTTETTETSSKKGTEVVLKQPTEAAVVATQRLEATPTEQEDEEVVFHGKIKASLESLERANINVTRGDFRAAMIYRNSSKPHQEKSVQTPSIQALCTMTETEEPEVPLKPEGTGENARCPPQNEIPATSFVSEKSKRPSGPKPAIPPKPEHLKAKQSNNQSTSAKNLEATQNNTGQPKEMVPPVPQPKLLIEQDLPKSKSDACVRSDSVQGHQRNQPSGEAQETEVRHQIERSDNIDRNSIIGHQQMNVKSSIGETNESHVAFHDAFETLGGKKTVPVKPKRAKIAQPDNKNLKAVAGDKHMPVSAHVDPDLKQITSHQSCGTCGETADSKDKHEKEIKTQESKVEMRGKKGRTETEDERRQRLSVHMDEIMRGNITAAMEIFDNLRKQQELQSILSRVEEIEKDTSEVDVRSLRRVFENVPDWVVSSDKKKQNKVRADNRDERLPVSRESTESKSSVAHVFGDLERASAEITNLKEQTLARLLDVEEAIKKALISVSTLKSDSDIAGLSSLFKESLGDVQGSPSSGSGNKISRSKSQQVQKSVALQENAANSDGQDASADGAAAKPLSSPPSSPAFISIQSLAKKADQADPAPPEILICPTCQQNQKLEETFRTTKTLMCNSPAQNRRDPRKGGQKQNTSGPLGTRQTGCEGNGIAGAEAASGNHEKIDNSGKKLYSSKTSTMINTQPETVTSSARHVVISPATYQVNTNPHVNPADNLVPK